MEVETTSNFAGRGRTLNEIVLERASLPVWRFFTIDQGVYEDGVLLKRTEELLGLVASTALRCDDCIRHHLTEATAAGATEAEIGEALGIALVVGARSRCRTCGTCSRFSS